MRVDAVTGAVDDQPPRTAPDEERAVLSCVLLTGGRALTEIPNLSTEHFFDPTNRRIYAEMLALDADTGSVDYVELIGRVRRGRDVNLIGRLSELAECSPAPATPLVSRYAASITEASLARHDDRAYAHARQKLKEGASPAEVAGEVQDIVVSRFDTQMRKTGKRPSSELTPLCELLAEPAREIAYLIDGLLIAGGTSLGVGRPKIGKSTFARFIASCVATGNPFLGRRVHTGPVVLCQFEEHRDILREQLRALGLTGDEAFFVWADTAPLDGIAWLANIIKEHKPSFVVVDPLFKLVRVVDANDYAKVSAALEPLNEIARESGAHLHLVHHLAKHGEQVEEGGSLGSTAIDGLADAILTLQRRDKTRTIRSLQRYGVKLEEVVLDFDAATGRFSALGKFAEIRTETAIQGVTTALVTAGELTEDEILTKVSGDTGVIRRALRQGVTAKLIRRTGKGRRGEPFRYALANAELSFSQ